MRRHMLFPNSVLVPAAPKWGTPRTITHAETEAKLHPQKIFGPPHITHPHALKTVPCKETYNGATGSIWHHEHLGYHPEACIAKREPTSPSFISLASRSYPILQKEWLICIVGLLFYSVLPVHSWWLLSLPPPRACLSLWQGHGSQEVTSGCLFIHCWEFQHSLARHEQESLFWVIEYKHMLSWNELHLLQMALFWDSFWQRIKPGLSACLLRSQYKPCPFATQGWPGHLCFYGKVWGSIFYGRNEVTVSF